MEKMSPETFKERFGENTAIAALALIVEDEEKDKKRLIQDATHGVRVNHRIKCRDKLRAPGAREKKHLLLKAMDRKERPFSIVGDIKKAHRRFKHLAKEHGFLACQLDSRDGPEGQLDNVHQQGGHLRRELRQLLVDPHCCLWGQGNSPPSGTSPEPCCGTSPGPPRSGTSLRNLSRTSLRLSGTCSTPLRNTSLRNLSGTSPEPSLRNLSGTGTLAPEPLRNLSGTLLRNPSGTSLRNLSGTLLRNLSRTSLQNLSGTRLRNLFLGPLRFAPKLIWAEDPKAKAVGEKHFRR